MRRLKTRGLTLIELMVGLAVMAGAALTGWFHYLRKGPLETPEEETTATDDGSSTQGEQS